MELHVNNLVLPTFVSVVVINTDSTILEFVTNFYYLNLLYVGRGSHLIHSYLLFMTIVLFFFLY